MPARDDERNPGAAPFFLAPLAGTALALEPAVEVELTVGLGGAVDGLELDVAAISPAPPLPAAVRGSGIGVLVSSGAF